MIDRKQTRNLGLVLGLASRRNGDPTRADELRSRAVELNPHVAD